ncbi:MAG: DUF302 domain-containing protein [Robiginitomaculum sp.]|nr:DUF302 domain-containing protein [Robiginitomaculum sp.]
MIAKFVTAGVLAAGLVACAPTKIDEIAEITPMTAQLNTGIITQPSANSVDVTIDRLEVAVKAKGLRVFARVDHQRNAKDMGLDMRPNTLLIFGSPKIGSPLMNENPTMGLDLPVKALAWQDENGNVFLSYNAPAYLKDRHGIEKATMPLTKMSKALAGLTAHATTGE